MTKADYLKRSISSICSSFLSLWRPVFVYNKFGKAKIVTPLARQEPVAITFIIESLPEYAADSVETGDPVTDRVTSAYLGNVTKLEKNPDITFGVDNEGKVVRSSKKATVRWSSQSRVPGYSMVRL